MATEDGKELATRRAVSGSRLKEDGQDIPYHEEVLLFDRKQLVNISTPTRLKEQHITEVHTPNLTYEGSGGRQSRGQKSAANLSVVRQSIA